MNSEARVDTDIRPLGVLIVCTANVCRSPVGAQLLELALMDSGHLGTVRSAGIRALERQPHPHTVDAGARVGVDISRHRARTVTRELINSEGSDLVLGMTREHLRHVVGLEPGAWGRTFTIKEFARRAAASPATEDMSWSDWVASLAVGRKPTDFMLPDPADDVADPFGKAAALHGVMVNELVGLIDDIVWAAPAPPRRID